MRTPLDLFFQDPSLSSEYCRDTVRKWSDKIITYQRFPCNGVHTAYAACVRKTRRRRAIYFLKLLFYLFRRGVPSGVDCCENRTLPPRLGTSLTSSIINWHKATDTTAWFGFKDDVVVR